MTAKKKKDPALLALEKGIERMIEISGKQYEVVDNLLKENEELKDLLIKERREKLELMERFEEFGTRLTIVENTQNKNVIRGYQ